MTLFNKNTFINQKISLDVSVNKLLAGMKNSDFLVSDENCVHRLVGLRFDPATMQEPEIALICARHQMAAAKQIAFSLAKRVYPEPRLSARLFRNYYAGQRIMEEDYRETAKIYSDYFHAMKSL